MLLSAARSGKASPFKGFDTLEAALPHIARAAEGRDVILLALGQDAPDTEIGGVRVRFVPFVSEPARVAEYYRAADLYLHPARAENFPLAILEAMACGVPVVASDVGGIPEIVVDAETGLLVPAGDPQALAAAASALLADDARRAAFAAAGVSRVRAEFTLERQVERYLDWYAEILEAALVSADLHILQVSPLDIGGGAEKVALDLHRAYLQRGLDAWLAVATRTGDDPNVLLHPEPTNATRRGPARFSARRNRSRRAPPDARRFAGRSTGSEDRRRPRSHGPGPARARGLRVRLDAHCCPRCRRRRPTSCTCTTCTAGTSTSARSRSSRRSSPRFSPCTTCGRSPATARIRSPASAGARAAATAPTWRSPSRSAETPAPRTAASSARPLSAGGRLRVATPSRWLKGLVEASGLADSLAETPRHPQRRGHRRLLPRTTAERPVPSSVSPLTRRSCCSRRARPSRARSRGSRRSKRRCR